jgi:chromosome segregation ATPase
VTKEPSRAESVLLSQGRPWSFRKRTIQSLEHVHESINALETHIASLTAERARTEQSLRELQAETTGLSELFRSLQASATSQIEALESALQQSSDPAAIASSIERLIAEARAFQSELDDRVTAHKNSITEGFDDILSRLQS